jgi:hydroxymethylbilane synthase
MSIQSVRIATRNSPLALWQAEFVRAKLQHLWPNLSVKLVPMTTSGDRFMNSNLQKLGGKGLFVKELEQALLAHEADIAVHSMKDVPYSFPDNLTLPVICERENPFDAFVSIQYPSIDLLPIGAILGTSSLRRAAQILAYRPDLKIHPLRGNVGTRLARLDQGEYDAIILAAAGLKRLGLEHRIQHIIDEEIMLPACGQGAIGIECRTDDQETQAIIAPLHHPLDALCVNTERTVNTRLGGGCHTPVAIFCQQLDINTLVLKTKIASTDGQIILSEIQQGEISHSAYLAEQCTENLKKNGALELLKSTLP